MAVPTTRQEFKLNLLRRLGAPVLKINMDDDQIDDRIDEALQYFWDYHFDGSDKVYLKHQVTADDKTNQYIVMPDNIIGAVNIFDIGSALQTNNMFSIRYQIVMNDLYTLTSVSMVPYYMAMSHLAFLEQMLVGKQPLRYNRHINNLYIDMDWERVQEGEWLVVEAYQLVDPNTYTKVWSDRWLQRYAACLIKQNWGQNLSKYGDMSLPGGIKFNGQKYYDDATKEREELEKEMVYTYSLPVTDMIG